MWTVEAYRRALSQVGWLVLRVGGYHLALGHHSAYEPGELSMLYRDDNFINVIMSIDIHER